MPPSAAAPTNWITVAESRFPWERDALEYVRRELPPHDAYRAWANFEFIADDGSINEVDLLVFTPQGFFLIEIKSRPGRLLGDSGTWLWETDGQGTMVDNPLFAANTKAKRLRSLLQKQHAFRGRGPGPFVETLVFCSDPDLQCDLSETGRFRVCLRDVEARGDRPGRPGIIAAGGCGPQRPHPPGLDHRRRRRGVISALAPTAAQIRAQVADIRRKLPNARVIGIHAGGRWTGGASLEHGTDTYRIYQCDSPLAMRLALRDEADGAVRVLITALEEGDLEEDLLLRLAKRRLFPVDSWQIVRSLFQAHAVDPRLTRHPWIADTLIDRVPAESCRPAPAGFLDAETVWPILLRHTIGLEAERPDLAALLKWSTSPEDVRRLRESPEEFRRGAAEWLAAWAGPAAEAVLRCAAASERPDALRVGLAAGVVFHPEASGRLERAAGRMEERFLGGAAPGEVALRRWSAAAEEVVRSRLADRALVRQQLQRADEILREVGAEELAWLSDTSPLGFDQRLAELGRAIGRRKGQEGTRGRMKAEGGIRAIRTPNAECRIPSSFRFHPSSFASREGALPRRARGAAAGADRHGGPARPMARRHRGRRAGAAVACGGRGLPGG